MKPQDVPVGAVLVDTDVVSWLALREARADNYTVLPPDADRLVSSWVELRSATINTTTADDRERRQNDSWIAATALSADPPLPIATGNLRDFRPLVDASVLKLVHPDL